MCGQDNEQFWCSFQNFKMVGFLKIQILKNILNDLEVENL
jgi:hypothetical protein